MSRTNLARYRVERAKEIVKEAEDSFKQNHFSLAVNRSYYAMFTSARVLLALKELDSSIACCEMLYERRYHDFAFSY